MKKCRLTGTRVSVESRPAEHGEIVPNLFAAHRAHSRCVKTQANKGPPALAGSPIQRQRDSRLVVSLIIATLLLVAAPHHAIAKQCPTEGQCDANCSVSYAEYWRHGTPGFEADHKVCMQRCMSPTPGCTPPEPEMSRKPSTAVPGSAPPDENKGS